MEHEITAVLVIELLGRPAEHIASALEQLIEKLGKEPEIQIVKNKIYPPKESEKTKGIFFTFAEIEIKVKNLSRLAEICFVYMPSSVEIIQPYELKIQLNDANALLNLLVGRLHNYDAIAKRLTIENTILQNQLKQLGAIRQQIPEAVKPVIKKAKASKAKARKKKPGKSQAKA